MGSEFMGIGGMSQEVKSRHLVKIYQQLIIKVLKSEITIDFKLYMYYVKKF
jgi:hypothetical protein